MKQMKRRKKACNNMITRNNRHNEQEHKHKKNAHKICRQKREYCLNHSLKKWKLLIITMKQEI